MAEELNKSMNEFDSFLKNKFLFYYYNALVINYSKLDQKKALEVLDQAKRNTVIQSLPTFGTFIYLNTGLIYYDQKKYNIAVKHFSRLILQKDFINLSSQFQLKIMIAELIIRYQLNQADAIEEKLKKIRRNYKKNLAENKRDHHILLIIQELIYCTNIRTDKKLQSKITQIRSMKLNNSADNTDIINYNKWLANLQNNDQK